MIINRIYGYLVSIVALTITMTLIAGCTISSSGSEERDENKETVQTYLEKEFTGPNEELKTIFDIDALYPPELQTYLEVNYEPLVADLEDIVNSNYALAFVRFAHENGYQIQPTTIDIQKMNDTETLAYDYEVQVEYSKDGQTNTAVVTGRINLNDEGKISMIRKMDDGGLLDKLRNK